MKALEKQLKIVLKRVLNNEPINTKSCNTVKFWSDCFRLTVKKKAEEAAMRSNERRELMCR